MPPRQRSAGSMPLARSLLPIGLAVLVQMIGVGITLSTLPLFLTSMGATPAQLGCVISMFSAAQMVGCPLLVSLSGRVGRLAVLRLCLIGNALAALLTSFSRSWTMVAIARVLAGFTAASVPVAQVAVTDVVAPGNATSKALSQVASAASLGIISGPAAGGLVSELARRTLGATPDKEARFVFAASGLFAALVLLLTARVTLRPHVKAEHSSAESTMKDGTDMIAKRRSSNGAAVPATYAQLLCRWVALVCSFAVVAGIATYTLFANRFLGYGQREISLTQSAAAALALCVNLLVLPRLIDCVGEAVSCAIGLVLLGLCFGACSLITLQPLHFLVFLASRAGLAMADTTAAALSVRNSSPEHRGRNIALLQSTQSGSRILSPLLAQWLYTICIDPSMSLGLGSAGTLPFLACGALALLTAPVPLLLRPLH